MENYETLGNALDKLKERGYDADFATQTVCLYCGDLDMRLDPEDFHVDAVYRFAGDSNPAENKVLYAISSATGVKGTLVDSEGADPGSLSSEMTSKLKPVAPNI